MRCFNGMKRKLLILSPKQVVYHNHKIFLYFFRQGNYARPLCNAALLWLQLWWLPRSLAEHGEPKGPHSSAQDLPCQLVQKGSFDRRLPLARLRGKRPRPGVDLQALQPREGGWGGQEEHYRLAARRWHHRHQRAEQQCGYGCPVRRAQAFLAEGDEGVESLLHSASWSRSAGSGGGWAQGTGGQSAQLKPYRQFLQKQGGSHRWLRIQITRVQ